MLVNVSNHPAAKWGTKQLQAALLLYGELCDLPFPNVPPSASEKEVKAMAKALKQDIVKLQAKAGENFAVHLMGEMTLCFHLTKILKRSLITVVASTSERRTVENPDGSKTISFDFVQFRQYV
jgi:hypothetical protein